MGMEAYFQPDLGDEDNVKANHLVLHAKNFEGWKNLIRLSSEAFRSGYKRVPISYKPIMDYAMLKRYSEGLICTTACMSSYPNQLILAGDSTGALEAFKTLQEIFGEDLFIEIMPHDFEEQRTLNKELIGISTELSLPLIATVDAHYPYEGWHDTHDIMLMVSTGQTFEKRKVKKDKGEDVYKFECESLWLMPEEEVASLFQKHHPDLPEFMVANSIQNTMELVDRVEHFKISKANKMPKVDTDSTKYLTDLCEKRLGELFGSDIPGEYTERLEYELSVMDNMDVLDYIYIIADAIKFAKDEGIRVGPGRGSSAGSLVCYLTGITAVDPLPYGLLFERFLNPDRISMPDIDSDFQDDRVGEIEDYLKSKYGEDKVALVCGFQTFQPKAALKKISTVYDVPFSEVNNLTNTIDDKVAKELKTLEACADHWPEVAEYAKKYPEIWKHASRIQGNISTLSKHPCALVIMDQPMNDFMPTIRSKNMKEVTGWSDKSDFPIISDYGMLKIDALSTKVLTVQGNTIDLVKSNKNEDVKLEELSIYSDPYAVDPKVMDAFSKGLVVGVWQFGGSAGSRKLIKNIKPDNMFDLAAANALIRPGSASQTGDYINRKNGREPVTYFHPDAEDILKRNYGLIIYQEDVMKIVQRFGGFTAGEADTLRKMMGKEYRKGKLHVLKYLADLGYKEKFYEGALKFGLNDRQTELLWATIISFGEYGFNASHAVAYAVQAYEDMWLKVHNPQEFYTTLLTERPKDISKIDKEARLFNVRISPPDINKSSNGFTIDGDKILFGLEAIKGIGTKSVDIIAEKRPYTSVEDFRSKTPKRPVSSAVVTALEKSGAFDEFGVRGNWSAKEILEAEEEILGIALSKEDLIYENIDVLDLYIEEEESLENRHEGYNATIGGEIDSVRVLKTKNGDPMAFVDISYMDSAWSVTVFPDQWIRYRDELYRGANVMVKGKKNTYNGKTSYILDYIMPIDKFLNEIKEVESVNT